MTPELEVGGREAGMRLDVFLTRRVDGVSRARARRLIADGHVEIDGRPARKRGTLLRSGDRVRVLVDPPRSNFVPLSADGTVQLRVVYEDAWLTIVDKPAGVPTHPLRADETSTLANALLDRYPEMAGVGYTSREPGIVHRLDNDTSGLLLAARHPDVFDALRATLASGAMEKRYEVLVEGALDAPSVIDAPIGKRPRDSRRALAHLDRLAAPPKARPARTEILEATPVGGGFTRATVRVSVALRHQIRAHFSAIGRPLVGDTLYGGAHREWLGRHFLHASELRLTHPISGRPVQARAPLPRELADFVGRMLRPEDDR